MPFSQWQGEIAGRYIVGAPLGISVVPGCSGLDVMSLCVAALLSYPVAWRRRLVGAGLGVLLLFVLNILRISALAVTSQTPAFQTLHVYVWPALLVAATLAWIALWIKTAERPTATAAGTGPRFMLWSAVLLAAYVIAVQILTEAQVLDRAAKAVAGMAAGLLTALGTEASVTGNVLRARHVEYLITPECITTPLIALYLAAVFASPIGWRTRVIGIVACLPIFVSLAVLRLLTVALPPLILGTDLILTHAFHQIVTGVAVVIAFATWARGERSRRQAAGIAVLAVTAVTAVAIAASVTGLNYARSLAGALHFAHLPVAAGVTPIAGDGDVQGATMVMPIFQVALFLALAAVAWHRTDTWRWTIGLAVLIGSQLAVLAALGWMEASGVPPLSPLLVRGWAVAIPLLLAVAMCRAALHAPRAQFEEVSA